MSSEEGKKEPFQIVIKESDLKEIYSAGALKMAREAAVALNLIMRSPYDYRKFKKIPKENLVRVVNFLLKMAQQEPKEPKTIIVKEEPKEESLEGFEHEGIVIKNAYKEDIHRMIVACKSNSEIAEMLFEKYDASINGNTLAAYIVRYRKTSEYIKETKAWSDSLGELRLNHKRGRLGELETLYLDAYRAYQSKPTKPNVELCLKILEQARKEAMPTMTSMIINNNSVTQNIFTNILAKEEEQAIFERLPLHEIIIGRVAAKYKRDPYLLQRRLQNSYYASQAGARGMDNIGEAIEYPTSILYNVEDLGARWKAIQAEEAKVMEDANVSEGLSEEASDIKAAILKRVAERKKAGEQKDEDKEDN